MPTGRGNGEWNYETTGKEDQMFSPFLRKPFKKALEAGFIPPQLSTIAGTWGTVTDQGDLTYLNLVHVPEIDGTDPNDLTIGEMRGAARRFTPWRRCASSCPAARTPSCAISA
jgi:hypothetical protein